MKKRGTPAHWGLRVSLAVLLAEGCCWPGVLLDYADQIGCSVLLPDTYAS